MNHLFNVLYVILRLLDIEVILSPSNNLEIAKLIISRECTFIYNILI